MLDEVRADGRGLGADARGRGAVRTSSSASRRRSTRPSSSEVKAFLAWVAADHFTFLGYREYDLVRRGRRGRPEGRPGLRSRDPARRPAPPYTKLRPKALELARAPHVLVLTKANSRCDRAPSGVPRLHRRQEVRARRSGRRASVASSASTRPPPTRPVRATIPLLRGKVDERARAGPASRRTATTRRRCSRSSSPTRATRCSRSRADELFDDRDGGPRARRAPARPPVRPPRPARPVRRVPGHDSARPLQHREPRAGRRDPARGVRRHPPRLDAAAVGVGARPRATTSSTARTACPSATTSPRSRRGWRRGDARLERRSPRRADRRARGGAAASSCTSATSGVPARLPLGLGGALGRRRHRPHRGARARARDRS